jgi:fatty acid desaturase
MPGGGGGYHSHLGAWGVAAAVSTASAVAVAAASGSSWLRVRLDAQHCVQHRLSKTATSRSCWFVCMLGSKKDLQMDMRAPWAAAYTVQEHATTQVPGTAGMFGFAGVARSVGQHVVLLWMWCCCCCQHCNPEPAWQEAAAAAAAAACTAADAA